MLFFISHATFSTKYYYMVHSIYTECLLIKQIFVCFFAYIYSKYEVDIKEHKVFASES